MAANIKLSTLENRHCLFFVFLGYGSSPGKKYIAKPPTTSLDMRGTDKQKRSLVNWYKLYFCLLLLRISVYLTWKLWSCGSKLGFLATPCAIKCATVEQGKSCHANWVWSRDWSGMANSGTCGHADGFRFQMSTKTHQGPLYTSPCCMPVQPVLFEPSVCMIQRCNAGSLALRQHLDQICRKFLIWNNSLLFACCRAM